MMNWNKNTDCCKWSGVTCNHYTGDVISIDLSCGMLQGTLHRNTSLFRLPHLQTLNLAYNDLTDSQLPRDFSNRLTHLNISQCGFTGSNSWEILLLPKLVSLDLSWNYGLHMQPDVLKNLLQNSSHLSELLMPQIHIGWVLPTFFNLSSSLKSLDLSYTDLQGKLLDNIFDLQYLEKLDLSANFDLTGPLPNVNTSLNIPLKRLDLSNCGLVGSLPKSLANLRHLTSLDLSYNNLTGILPSFLFTLPFLEDIILGSNTFSGGLPSTLFNHQSLKRLSLGGNQFNGKINGGSSQPSFIQLVNLTYLSLSWNNFTGLWDLDTLLSSLPNLEELHLSNTGLSVVTNNGSSSYVNPNFRRLGLAFCKLTLFPESLRTMKNLTYLDLSNNDIHGRIPDWAGKIGENGLYYLDLSYNSITGLPQFQWDGMEYLNLQSNQIQGSFPPSICNMSRLLLLDISNNSFRGVIPQCLGNINSFLQFLHLQSNQIQGQFPTSVCNMRNLVSLDVSDNSISGVIPQCLGNIISSLWMIDMGNNSFHGIIPDVYEDCGELEGLILNGNQLQGEVPSSLSNCQSLMVLDLGNNNIKGTFPHWLGDLPKLQALVLKSNKFHGPIETPSSKENTFPSMRVLDLSHNWFAGHLPQKYLKSFNAMKNVVKNSTTPTYLSMGGMYYSVTTAVKGRDLEFPKISVDYVIVVLSNNRFEGEIPGIIGCLVSLKVLDLSHNSLTGKIPSVLGNLLEIESLDLSWNQLTGEIPQSLAHLTFIGFLNLSQNHLVGRIPSGTQFSTFEASSFVWNPELCGLPLPTKCERRQETQLEIDGDGDGDGDGESGFTWRVVILGYGCGTLLGLVMGYVMLSTGRPKWFNAIADAGEHMIRTRHKKRRYVYIGK
ncbi:hypothetical protein Lser_V15G08978 [Lactuca serriola]